MRVSLLALGFFGLALLAIGLGRTISGAAPYSASAGADVERVASPGATPVIVELFTSEGCSSCPPADRLLAHLQRTQPVAGADIIALEEHVDYWNDLGWKDPFSSSQFSNRQDDYAHFFRTSGPYTPQMIVDGKSQFVGSNEHDALAAIGKAARGPKANVELEQISDPKAGAEESGTLTLHIRLGPIAGWRPGDLAEVVLAVTEDDLSSNVTRGENAGDQLVHRAVVRHFQVLGRLDSTGAFAAEPKVTLAKDWKRDNLRVVAFVQDRTSRDVLGIASLRLSSPAKPS
ncbi:MAG TPA: DUF1223 domain-containing protein [Candidatus Acidoferrales bacterium]|jgi:hypothetical protein|nr:DUF1223 domain-containing protein [Candidatus Acidoferrales bacterium]